MAVDGNQLRTLEQRLCLVEDRFSASLSDNPEEREPTHRGLGAGMRMTSSDCGW